MEGLSPDSSAGHFQKRAHRRERGGFGNVVLELSQDSAFSRDTKDAEALKRQREEREKEGKDELSSVV
nr:hypothetical protein CFP56_62700 [Quercus suber]